MSSVQLHVSVVRARGLPRRIFRLPSAYVELYVVPGGESAASTSIERRTTTPTWNFSAVIELRTPHVPTLGVIVKDRAAADTVIGRAFVIVDACLVRGWIPLRRICVTKHDATALQHAGDVFVSIEWKDYCKSYRWAWLKSNQISQQQQQQQQQRQQQARATNTRRSANGTTVSNNNSMRPQTELREVDTKPARLFRAGKIVASVVATGIPVAVQHPILQIATSQQVLRGTEIRPLNYDHDCTQDGAHVDAQSSDEQQPIQIRETRSVHVPNGQPARSAPNLAGDTMLISNVTPTSSSSSNVNPAPRINFSTSRSALRTFASLPKLRRRSRSSAPPFNPEAHEEDERDGDAAAYFNPADLEDGKHDEPSSERPPPARSQESPSAQEGGRSKHHVRRTVVFGEFTFALLQPSLPNSLKLTVTNLKTHLPEPIAAIAEQTIELPTRIDGFGYKPSNNSKHYIMQLSLVEPGPYGGKVCFDVRLTYTACEPLASCNVVTPRFRELMEHVDEFSTQFKLIYPEAERLTYLFVGGLFTNHYPNYFRRNIDYLQERLRLPRVQCIPINTESGVVSNAKTIRDAVIRTCTHGKSIVLIGHSKGGLDILEAVRRHPEIVPFLYGIVTFQAPVGGTFIVDFVARSNLVMKAISSAIENVWKGERQSLNDLSYDARFEQLGLTALDGDDLRMGESSIGAGSSNYREEVGILSEEEANRTIVKEALELYRKVPVVAITSCAPFEVHKVRSAANVAGFASMAPIAQIITRHTGFACDGLVVPGDAAVPYCDLVDVTDMMHTEPALFVPGTKYPPGPITACALGLLFEKAKGVSTTDLKALLHADREKE